VLRVGTLAAVLSGLALAPTTASAAVTCDYSAATHTVTAESTANNNDISFLVLAGGAIGVNGTQCDAAATTANTDTIEYTDSSPDVGNDVEIDLRGGSFAPGFTDEGLINSDEIEFRIGVAGGQQNWITIWGHATGNDGISMGTQGITLNAFSEDGLLQIADEDVTNPAGNAFPAVSDGLVRVFAGGGNDAIKGNGSEDTGSVSAEDHVFNASTGNDTIIGGSGDTDNLSPGPGDDTVDGNGGTGNTLIMGQSNPVGVTVDLGDSAPQDTIGTGIDTISGMDNMQGTDQSDVLQGTNGENRIDGLGGADVIRGAGGDDELNGSLDNPNPPHQGDTLAYDGIAAAMGQSVDLDAPTSSGGQGADDISGFDNLIGSDYADPELTGTDLANRITGGAGNDSVFALAGNDTLSSDPGADTLRLGAGDDSFAAQDGFADTIDCSGGGADGGSFDLSPADVFVACADADGDGVADFVDACPTQAGPGNGCPAPQVSQPATSVKKKCKKRKKKKATATATAKKKKKCARKKRKRLR
jgi:hypothetical protein